MVSRVLRGFAALLFLALIIPGSLLSAVEYGGLGGVPANPDPNNDRTKSIFVYTISPGQNRQDAIRVVNNTDTAKTVEVYAADSEIASGGSFACRQKVDPRKDVGSWIKLSQTEIRLESLSSQVVPFEVSVPDRVSVGEHNGCIVIQEKEAAPQQGANGVQLSFRSALRVAITVPGDIVKEVHFTDLTVKNEDKKYVITASLNNTGNVSLDTDVNVNVKHWFGRSAYQNGGVYPLLAQKDPVVLNFEFPRPYWGGFFRVAGSAAYNNDAGVPLGIPADKNVRVAAPSQMLFVPPQPPAIALMLLILILLIIFTLVIIRRLTARKRARKIWSAYKVQEGDTLVKLAARHKLNWRTVARANNIRAPYELKPGSTIKLPVKDKSE